MKTNLMGKTFEYSDAADLKKQIQAHHDKLTERYSATVLGVKKVEITVEDVPSTESSSQVLQQVLSTEPTPPAPTGTEDGGDVTNPQKTDGGEDTTNPAPSETEVGGAPVNTETAPEPEPVVDQTEVTDPVVTDEVTDPVVDAPVVDPVVETETPVVETTPAATTTTKKRSK